MTIKKTAITAVCSLLLGTFIAIAPVVADAAVFPEPRSHVSPDPEDRKTNRTATDDGLQEQLDNVFKPYSGISADAEKGIVTLTGNVENIQERDSIITRTRALPGVQDVRSLLKIKN